MISIGFTHVWMRAKSISWRLRHPMVTSGHILCGFLSVDQRRINRLWRDCPLSAKDVWNYLKENPAPNEPTLEYYETMVGISGQNIIDRATSLARGSPGEIELYEALRVETSSLIDQIRAHSGKKSSDETKTA